jgi:hypothetical protein
VLCVWCSFTRHLPPLLSGAPTCAQRCIKKHLQQLKQHTTLLLLLLLLLTIKGFMELLLVATPHLNKVNIVLRHNYAPRRLRGNNIMQQQQAPHGCGGGRLRTPSCFVRLVALPRTVPCAALLRGVVWGVGGASGGAALYVLLCVHIHTRVHARTLRPFGLISNTGRWPCTSVT